MRATSTATPWATRAAAWSVALLCPAATPIHRALPIRHPRCWRRRRIRRAPLHWPTRILRLPLGRRSGQPTSRPQGSSGRLVNGRRATLSRTIAFGRRHQPIPEPSPACSNDSRGPGSDRAPPTGRWLISRSRTLNEATDLNVQMAISDLFREDEGLDAVI